MSSHSPGPTPLRRRAVLAGLLFLQHGSGGFWLPLLGRHLSELGFTLEQIAGVFVTLPLATVMSPWLAGWFADRVMAAERYLLVSHLLLAGLLWSLAGAESYAWCWWLTLAVALVLMPALAISNAVVFRHLHDVPREFGGVRLFGTLSWVVFGGWMGLWLSRPTWLPGALDATLADGLRFAALAALGAAAICLILPHSPPSRDARHGSLAAAIRSLCTRDAIVLMSSSVLLLLGLGFVYPLAQLFLTSRGVPDNWLAPALSLGQVGEIAAFLLVAPLIQRFGLKTVFLLGASAWVLRFAIWSWGESLPLVIAAVGLHGFAFAWVVGVGQMYIHSVAPPDARASAQALHMVIVMGFASIASQWWVARSEYWFAISGADGTAIVDYRAVYFWPGVVAALATILFAVGFSRPRRAPVVPVPAPPPAS